MKSGRVYDERELVRTKEVIKANNHWKDYYEFEFNKVINQPVRNSV